MLGKIEGGRRRATTEDEMVGWHHLLNGHEFDQAPGVVDGQGSLAYCSPWGRCESDMTERLSRSIALSTTLPHPPPAPLHQHQLQFLREIRCRVQFKVYTTAK